MKKWSVGVSILVIILSIFVLGFNYKDNKEPNIYYQVYLDDEVVGTIKSKDELFRMIDSQGKYIKNKYKTDKVYEPNGLQVKKIATYKSSLKSAKEVYDIVRAKKPFTIKGYQLTIKDGKNVTKVYATDKKIFKSSLDQMVNIFVGADNYKEYKNKTQSKITTTGSVIENVYIENHMTIIEKKIAVTNKIYIDKEELAKYLLYGDITSETKYKVKVGETIESVAYSNKISPEEFLIYNPQFSNRNNLLFPGQEVTIGMIDPKVKIVVESKIVSDIASKYRTEEQYDANRVVGDDSVVQEGEDGTIRTTQKAYYMNGALLRSETLNTEELKPAINAIIIRGEKVIPYIGSGSWVWPVDSYSFLRGLEYWINPDNGQRVAHTGVDIADNCGKPIYAANNGVVAQATGYYPNGNFVTINHNNGYYTLYAHMTRYIVSVGQVVGKGQVIGYVGQTGQAYGCHLHFEAFSGGLGYNSRNFFDARSLY